MSRDSRLNKFDKAAQRQEVLERKLAGSGLYVYKNHTSGELLLPKPTLSGKRRIAVNEEFQGDSYFMQYVKNNMLTFIREITTPEQQRKDKIVQEQKLIVDQPDKVTARGQVEHVVISPKPKKLNEEKSKQSSDPEVLLNENPDSMDGVEIVN